jgi:hypothetical protein
VPKRPSARETVSCYEQVACPGGAVDNPVTEDTTSPSGLHYSTDDEQFVYVWKTSTGLSGQCADFVLALADGTEHRAHFAFK